MIQIEKILIAVTVFPFDWVSVGFIIKRKNSHYDQILLKLNSLSIDLSPHFANTCGISFPIDKNLIVVTVFSFDYEPNENPAQSKRKLPLRSNYFQFELEN